MYSWWWHKEDSSSKSLAEGSKCKDNTSCTYHLAGPLELAEPILQELNELATAVSIAYDSSVKKEVMFMTFMLAFVGDSPMAAEVTNTPNPGTSNNPCRMCGLQCPQGEERCTMEYLRQFFGHPHMPPPSTWQETIDNTYDLWETSQSGTQKEFERKDQAYGIRDRINFALIDLKRSDYEERLRIVKMQADTPKRMINPFAHLIAFDGCKDTPIEILHVILLGVVKYLWKDFMGQLKESDHPELEARWHAFNTEGMNGPPIQPQNMIQHYKSLMGKEFRLILQATPFALFPMMNEQQQEIWTSLCQIASMAFQTHINNMEEFIWEMENRIHLFLYHVCIMNGRWANKPKFHHILHLPKSIRRYGPASLFATEKFESFNGVIRNASIHSNRQSPSRDIATCFNNFNIIRLLLSGAILCDHEHLRYFQASREVQALFDNNVFVQKSMGYNSHWFGSSQLKPTIHGHRGARKAGELVPVPLLRNFPTLLITKVQAVKLNDK
ncbi:hypothetical protein PTTG_07907 [Puccinia triticina 1-1 BBBD Race 1]|uniref:Uncharacterized protein n=1 Tax=Puccinia triticina (isolate 1-1 / race 1 (BBBD)) TaxID=630390 RepID=A0A180GIG1_PUCT1|nr:hypothetical protein PTTG_07907 [Puccinia triticina 1-1 BBBD Race 1]